jgi:hypothetical protein
MKRSKTHALPLVRGRQGWVKNYTGTIPHSCAADKNSRARYRSGRARAQREDDKRGITLKQLVNDALERKLSKEEQRYETRGGDPGSSGEGRPTD